MQFDKLTPVSVRAMSGPERENLKAQLTAKKESLHASIIKIKDVLKWLRDREEIVGYMTINEFLADHHIELTDVQKSRLGDLLQKGVNKGKWEQGKKTVTTQTKARCARLATYEPTVIKGVLRELRRN